MKDPIQYNRDEANIGIEKCSVEINLELNPFWKSVSHPVKFKTDYISALEIDELIERWRFALNSTWFPTGDWKLCRNTGMSFQDSYSPRQTLKPEFPKTALSPLFYSAFLGFSIGRCDLSIYGDVTIRLPVLDSWKSHLYLPSRNQTFQTISP